jgi:hypothetical protein
MSLEPFGAGLLCWPKTNTLDPVETTIERECSIGYSLWRGRVQGEELAADLLKLAVPAVLRVSCLRGLPCRKFE